MSETLEQLADACLLVGFDGLHAPDWLRRRLADGLGGVVLYHGNVAGPEQAALLAGEIRAERPTALIGVDEEGGDVTRLEIATGSSWPGNLALGVVDDIELTATVAAQIGVSLTAAGIDLDFAPSVDVNVRPDNPVIGVRSFGSDPALVARHAAAFVTGLQSVGVAACAKHFPGHGNTAVDSHYELPVLDDGLDVLRATAWPPFQAAIAAGVKAVMTAHVVTSAIDAVPATVSRPVITGALRGELGFDGVIVTDAMDMDAFAATCGIVEGGVQALIAGVDALCLGPYDGRARSEAVRDAIVAAVRSGRLPEVRLADAARRVEALAGWTHSRNDPPRTTDPTIGDSAARRALTSRGVTRLTAPPVVFEIASDPNPAVGATAWGLGSELMTRLPGTTVRRLDEQSAIRLGAALPAEQPIVLAVRNVWFSDWAAAAIAYAVDRRPDTIVVDMGVPRDDPWIEHYVATHGAARACSRAAVDLLLGERSAVASEE